MHPWQLNWYHFGDLITATGGKSYHFDNLTTATGGSSYHESFEAFCKALLGSSDREFRSMFEPHQNGVPTVARIFFENVLPQFKGKRRDHAVWRGSDFYGFKIQVVSFESSQGYAALLTPDALYLSGTELTKHPDISQKLKGLGIHKLEFPPRNATGGLHMWMMPAMKTADTLSECYANELPENPTALSLAIQAAALRVQASNRVGQFPDGDKENEETWQRDIQISQQQLGGQVLDVGSFLTEKLPNMERRFTFLTGVGMSKSESLILHLGTLENSDEGGLPMGFNPWPCGGFQNCGGGVNCEDQKQPAGTPAT